MVNKIGNVIKESRIAMSTADFVRSVGITRSYLSRTECHDAVPSPKVLRKIAHVLQIDYDGLAKLAVAAKVKESKRAYIRRYYG